MWIIHSRELGLVDALTIITVYSWRMNRWPHCVLFLDLTRKGELVTLHFKFVKCMKICFFCRLISCHLLMSELSSLAYHIPQKQWPVVLIMVPRPTKLPHPRWWPWITINRQMPPPQVLMIGHWNGFSFGFLFSGMSWKLCIFLTAGKEGNEWDEISQALSAKKEQLIRENGWNKEGSGKGSWSYRALRSSALGPTMAILRARNDIWEWVVTSFGWMNM